MTAQIINFPEPTSLDNVFRLPSGRIIPLDILPQRDPGDECDCGCNDGDDAA